MRQTVYKNTIPIGWLHRINLASLISNLEENLIDRDKAVRIIKAMRSVEDASEKGELPKFNTYIHFEPEILKRAGMDCSVMLVGRSSQDTLATVEFGLTKKETAAAVEQIARIQKSLCDLAERESGKVVPAYTNRAFKRCRKATLTTFWPLHELSAEKPSVSFNALADTTSARWAPVF